MSDSQSRLHLIDYLLIENSGSVNIASTPIPQHKRCSQMDEFSWLNCKA